MKCIEKLGKWELFKDGSMTYNGYYHIAADRLDEAWIEHLEGKVWIDFNEFIPLYIRACEINKVTKVSIGYDN